MTRLSTVVDLAANPSAVRSRFRVSSATIPAARFNGGLARESRGDDPVIGRFRAARPRDLGCPWPSRATGGERSALPLVVGTVIFSLLTTWNRTLAGPRSWREHPFVLMNRNTADVGAYFELPRSNDRNRLTRSHLAHRRKSSFSVADTAMPCRRWRIGHVNVEQTSASVH